MLPVKDKDKMKGRNIALPDTIYLPIKKESKRTGQSVASIIREALEIRAAQKEG